MSEKNGSNGLRLKVGLAEMLKGGVIMDVTTRGAGRDRRALRRRGRDGPRACTGDKSVPKAA